MASNCVYTAYGGVNALFKHLVANTACSRIRILILHCSVRSLFLRINDLP